MGILSNDHWLEYLLPFWHLLSQFPSANIMVNMVLTSLSKFIFPVCILSPSHLELGTEGNVSHLHPSVPYSCCPLFLDAFPPIISYPTTNQLTPVLPS